DCNRGSVKHGQKQGIGQDGCQDKVRALLNDIVGKYSVQHRGQMSETDFMAIKLFCDNFGEQNIFFKNGLIDPHPILSILIMPSATKELEKAFMLIRNLPYKMLVFVGSEDLHKILALVLITYVNLNNSVGHRLLQILFANVNKNQTTR
ncbi:unnamed protein product, partial [Didymodactylos carnosus]